MKYIFTVLPFLALAFVAQAEDPKWVFRGTVIDDDFAILMYAEVRVED